MSILKNLLVLGSAKFVNKIQGSITGDAGTVNSHTVEKDVPSTAVFTDTPSIYFGHCATAAATADKVVELDDPTGFTLRNGVMICVSYDATNSASGVTINVEGTGAKSISYVESTAYTGTDSTITGHTSYYTYYVYNGTYWCFVNYSNNRANNANTVPSAQCETAAGTAAKASTCTNYSLKANSYLHVNLRYENTVASALTFNVNSKGAKPLYINGEPSSASNHTLPAGSYIAFYNGTNWYFRTDDKLPANIDGDAATVSGHSIASDIPSDAEDILDSVRELPFVTPEMFGAVGDGSTDDTAHIQAAISSISSTGGTVYFAPKTYVVDSLSITTHNISLRGSKSSTTGRGTILIAASTNTGAMINVTTSSGMLIGGGIYDMALMANNARQRYTDAKEKIGINILNRAEFILQNVYISGFKNGGVYAKDWWDSDVIGLEIRACSIADTNAALYLGSENDSCNSLHFFGLHIEESPYQLAIEGVCSHIQFVASKFEGGAQIGEPNKGTRWIYIYEGVYAVNFVSCFFSDNATDTIWLDVRNNLTSIVCCQFSAGSGTLIKNYSANANYGNGIIVSNCIFEHFGRSEAPIYLKNSAILSNNIFDCQEFANSIYIQGNYNSINGNSFYASSTKSTPIFSIAGTDNMFVGNRYQGLQQLWIGAKGNHYDNKKEVFYTRTSTDQLASINFAAAEVPNIFWNSSTAVTLTSSNFTNIPNDAEITFYSGGGTLTFDTTIVQGGTTCTSGKSVHLKYLAALSKFIVA